MTRTKLTVQEKKAPSAIPTFDEEEVFGNWLDLRNEAESLSNSWKLDEALIVAKKTVAFAKNAFGPDHPNVLASLEILAFCHKDLKQYTQALRVQNRVLKISKRIYKSDPSHIARAMEILARVYREESRHHFDLARELLLDAKNIQTRTHGQVSRAVGHIQLETGNLYAAFGWSKYAENSYRDAVKTYEQALGPDHTLISIALNAYAELCTYIGSHTRAQPLYKRAIAITEKANGSESVFLLRSLSGLMNCYYHQNKDLMAKHVSKRVLKLLETHKGPDHPETLAFLRSLEIPSAEWM